MARRLQKREVHYVAKQLRSSSVFFIVERVSPTVDCEVHLQYYRTRQRLWTWLKANDKVSAIVSFLLVNFCCLLQSFSTGKERYARFLAAWYQFCGTFDIAHPESDSVWQKTIDGYEYNVSREERQERFGTFCVRC